MESSGVGKDEMLRTGVDEGGENFRGRVRTVAVRRPAGCGIVAGDAGEFGYPDRHAVRMPERNGVSVSATGSASWRLRSQGAERDLRYVGCIRQWTDGISDFFSGSTEGMFSTPAPSGGAAGSGGGIRMLVPSGGSDPLSSGTLRSGCSPRAVPLAECVRSRNGRTFGAIPR